MKSPQIRWKSPATLRKQAHAAARILPSSLADSLDRRLTTLMPGEMQARRPFVAEGDVDRASYLAGVRANLQAQHAHDPLSPDWRRALSQALLARMELTSLRRQMQTRPPAPPPQPARDNEPLERLLMVVGKALNDVLLQPLPTRTLNRFLRTLDRTLVPALQGIARAGESPDMGWGALFAAAAGGEAGTPGLGRSQALLLTALLPYREPKDLPELLPVTRNLVQRVPKVAPLLVGILGTHLRIDYASDADAVDLAMMGAALPVALGELKRSKGPARKTLGRAIVNGLLFDLNGRTTEYAWHYMRWMESCHDFGLDHPEQQIIDAIEADPDWFIPVPGKQLLHQARDIDSTKLGNDYLHELATDPLAPRQDEAGGPWGLMTGNPLWERYLAATRQDEEATPIYEFYLALQEAPPAEAWELEDAESTLQAVMARVPEVAHPYLFADTLEALNDGSERYLRDALHDWKDPFSPRNHPPPMAGSWEHPWRQITTVLIQQLTQRIA